ncbi:MAG: cbb3-type cytochrome c oxidase subunit I [Bacteroidia bacterium]|nr:cbb3-type cytochrome c oxidase subunit I [Bacteroidia bacterium]MBP9688069.1 cbb3-type cytochrome c oxidase subunit I [Bacteroidia bacterium]
MSTKPNIGKLFLALALCLLLVGIVFGLLASIVYVKPDFLKNSIGFTALRPLHVSFVTLWIIIAANGSVMSALHLLNPNKLSNKLAAAQLTLWLIAIVGIANSYFHHDFGGREYWEFNPIWALPIAAAWILYLINFIKTVKSIKTWPVYVWMWLTGGLFFMFTFIENYLWVFPYFRDNFVLDMTIQWKVNGSLVGSWNQLIYGTAFFLMDKITGNNKVGFSKIAFGMYFLGLFNLMFNWGHHVYTLPTDSYIRYIGYIVSMTEWIFFARIIFQWKQSVSDMKKNYHFFPYRFIMASDIWVFANMGLAVLMSIPVLNIYTHGTHVTVAHAMGTTIGINSMILLAACFMFLGNNCTNYNKANKWLNMLFYTTQISLLVFWLALNIAGIKKGIWQNSVIQSNYHDMMQDLTPYFATFIIAGFVLVVALLIIAATLLYNYAACYLKKSNSTVNLSHTKSNIL